MGDDGGTNSKSWTSGAQVRLLPSCRLTLGLMSSLSMFLLYMLRANLSLTVVCMVKTTVRLDVHDNGTLNTSEIPDGTMKPVQLNDSSDLQEGEFEWSRQFQGVVLSAYFYGYLATQLLGGWLAGRYGGKHVLGAGVLGAAIMTMLAPTAARLHGALLIADRVMVGAASGVIFPSVQTLWGLWAPPLERSFLSSISYIGMNLGSVAAFASSMVCNIRLDNGWPLVFYLTGSVGLLFWISWNFLAYSSPDSHPRISERERVYITTTTGLVNSKVKVPWLRILSSLPVISNIAAHTASTWFSYTAMTTLPLYLNDVLRLDIKQNGLFMMLPNLAVLVVSVPVGRLADFLRRRKIFTTKTVRKIYQGTSSFGCSIALIILSVLDYDGRYVAVALIVLLYVGDALCRCGFLVNFQDIAPRFSGEIFGLSNTVASIPGIVAPAVVGLLTPNGTRLEWQTVFFIAAGIFAAAGLLFVIFAEGEVLDWAKAVGNEPVVVEDNRGDRNGELSVSLKSGQRTQS